VDRVSRWRRLVNEFRARLLIGSAIFAPIMSESPYTLQCALNHD